jgi:hypothetical protein
LASAATVAASSFDMKITDPRELLDAIDLDQLQKFLGYQPLGPDSTIPQESLQYVEPFGADTDEQQTVAGDHASHEQAPQQNVETTSEDVKEAPGEVIKGRALRLGDFIDTDAVSVL